MTPFLKYVADDLCKRMGNDMSKLAVVFPNKRAALFLNGYLVESAARGCSEPIWAPRYMTINELFESLSPWIVADKIETICRIYKLYVKHTQSNESLDFFYGWGERILSDFDDVDKNMADVDRLFCNLRDIKELDSMDFLDSEQEKVLKRFFSDFSPNENSKIKKKFLELWEALSSIYHDLNDQLKSDGMAYEGALYRHVIDALRKDEAHLPSGIEHYAFVGFNVLDKVESSLFSFLMEKNKAWFYWDYDTFYTNSNFNFEAGTFLSQNLEKFPNELPTDFFSNLLKNKTIEIVASSTENAQVQAVAPWIQGNLTEDEKKTAIVLCNENLIQPLLHCIPQNVKEVNITKGYPIHHTFAYRVLEKAMDDIVNKNQTTNDAWLENTMEILHSEAKKHREGETDLEKTLHTEAFFKIYTTLSRFCQLTKDGWLNVEMTTLFKLIRQVMKQLSVAFHGEPAAGLQIMGVLETRCLDFKHIMLLSVGEGYLPGTVRDNSFIPYNLRREFGLTTSKHKVAVYAYYFYRLIQRAERIKMVYNNSTTGNSTGEMSRFITQLLVETALPIKHSVLKLPQTTNLQSPEPKAKPAEWVRQMLSFSPSAINEYMRCQLQFYFNRVRHLNVPQKPVAIIEPNVLGSVFHKTAELFYKSFEKDNSIVTPSRLKNFLSPDNDAALVKYIHEAMKEIQVVPNMIVEQIVKSFFKKLIDHDTKWGNFKIKALECEKEMPLELKVNGVTRVVKLKGNIDRMDFVCNPEINGGQETLRIVDYKTGGNIEKVSSMDDLFTPGEKHPHYVLQTFIYALLVSQQEDKPIMPSLFFINKYGADDYSPYIMCGADEVDGLTSSPKKGDKTRLENFLPLSVDFKKRLTALLEEILDVNKPFVPTSVTKVCENCDFHILCYGK